MRCITMYRPRADAEPIGTLDEQEMAKLGNLIEEQKAAGVLLANEGFQPTAKGARVGIDHGSFTVIDGPFAEAKEVITGFAILQAASKDEAVEHVKRFLSLMGGGECEVRLLREMGDLGNPAPATALP